MNSDLELRPDGSVAHRVGTRTLLWDTSDVALLEEILALVKPKKARKQKEGNN